MTAPSPAASDSFGQAAQALRELAESGRLVAEQAQEDRRQRRRTERVFMALLFVVALAIGSVAWATFSSYRLSAKVADCTTSGGQCFEQNRQQSANNRSALTRANLAIVACAQPGMSEAALTECVKKRLIEQGIDISLIDPNAGAPKPTPAPTGPPADTTIAPPGEQPVEPSPAQSPDRSVPDSGPGETGGTTP